MKKYILILFVSLLLLSMASAMLEIVKPIEIKGQILNFNGKDIEYNPIWEKYPPLQIKNNLGLPLISSIKFEGYINSHTESCSSNCESVIVIELKDKGVLIEDIRFKKLVGEDWIDYDFSKYNIYQNIKDETYYQDVYESQCDLEETMPNGTKYQNCYQVKTGIQTLSRPTWNLIDIKTEVDAGTYEIKIAGNKNPYHTLDWQIQTQGQWLEDWASWGFTSLTSGLISYFKFDETLTSGTVANDSMGYLNLTKTVSGTGNLNFGYSGGKNNNAINWSSGTNAYLSRVSTGNKMQYNWTVSAWLKQLNNISAFAPELIRFGDASPSAFDLSINATNYLYSSIYDGAWRTINIMPVANNTWYNVVVASNSSGTYYFVNGVLIINTAYKANASIGSGQYIGGYPAGYSFTGIMDEVGYWNRSLLPSEATQLYNSGLGRAYPFTLNSITLNSPSNNNNSNNPIQIFNCSATVISPATLMNISLWFNATGTWSLNETKTPTLCYQESANISNQTGIDGNCELNYSGNYSWEGEWHAIDSVDRGFDGDFSTYTYTRTITTNATLYINYTKPINANGGILNYRSSSLSAIHENVTIPENCFNQTKVSLKWFSYYPGIYTTRLYCKNDTDWQLIDSGTFIFEEAMIWNISINPSTFTKTLPQNSTKWNCQACDSDGDCAFASSNYTITIDSIAPVITITGGNGTNNLGVLNQNHTINFTATDLNLDKCWYYNGTVNKSLSSCSLNHLNKTIDRLSDNITLFANDTLGNTASQFVEWDFKVLKNNETYLNQTVEGALNTFTLNLSLQSGLNIQEVNLIYNGTSYNANAFIIGDNHITSRNIVIPGVITTTNFSFYWSVLLSDSTLINLSSHNQTVYNLSVDNCTLYSYGLYTFNLLDEETQASLSGVTTMDVAMNIYSVDRSYIITSFNKSYSSINPARICLGSTLLNQTNYSVDIIIRYEQNATHSIEYYNIVNDILSNSSILHTINLYDLLLTDTTEFRLTFIDADFVPRENALVYLMRQYIAENTFKPVELPKTDSNGQTVLHMVRNDVIYNIVIVDSITKEVLGTFNNIVAFCEDISIGKCEINLNAFSTEGEIYDYNEALGIIISNPNYDNTTRIISFDFVTTDGTTKTVNMIVTRNDIFGNNTVCDTTLISAGGTISCNVPSSIEDTNLITSIFVDGILVAYAHVQMDKSNLGYIGYIALFFMMISLVFMFSSSKEGVLIGLGLGVLAGIGLGLITGTVLGVGSVGIWIIILILLAFWKLNQGRNS